MMRANLPPGLGTSDILNAIVEMADDEEAAHKVTRAI